MAKTALSDGITHIAASPHTLNGIYENALPKIEKHLGRLKAKLAESEIPLHLYCGADVHLCAGMARRIENGEITTINNNGRYFLLEFPNYALPGGYEEEIFQLGIIGVIPVITHPERIPIFHYDLCALYDLISMGCLVQITAQSITGAFGREVMALTHKMLKLRQIGRASCRERVCHRV